MPNRNGCGTIHLGKQSGGHLEAVGQDRRARQAQADRKKVISHAPVINYNEISAGR
jgi:hypothetical protein